MTYTVWGGTLNPTHSLTHSFSHRKQITDYTIQTKVMAWQSKQHTGLAHSYKINSM